MRPHPLTLLPPLLALLTITHAQPTDNFITTMPTCWQTCFQSQFPNCPNQESTDTATLCVCGTALAQPSVFSALITCVTDHCNAHTDPTALTAPLDAWASACNTLEHPLPSGGVQSAERAVETGTATGTATTTSATATSSHAPGGKGSGDGSLVDLANMASRQRARSMLGLTVGIVAGVVWF